MVVAVVSPRLVVSSSRRHVCARDKEIDVRIVSIMLLRWVALRRVGKRGGKQGSGDWVVVTRVVGCIIKSSIMREWPWFGEEVREGGKEVVVSAQWDQCIMPFGGLRGTQPTEVGQA